MKIIDQLEPEQWHKDNTKAPKDAGVYQIALKIDNTYQILYVGQSANIYKRLQAHVKPSSILSHLKSYIKDPHPAELKYIALYGVIQFFHNDIYFQWEQCPLDALNDLEETTIMKQQPLFNWGGIDVPFKPYIR